MMSVFSTHVKKSIGSVSLGKGMQPISLKGAHTHTSTSPVSSQGSSHKCSHDVTTDISTKITDTSNVLLCHIQEGTGTKSASSMKPLINTGNSKHVNMSCGSL